LIVPVVVVINIDRIIINEPRVAAVLAGITIVVVQNALLHHFVDLDVVHQVPHVGFEHLVTFRLRQLTPVAHHSEREVQVLAFDADPVADSLNERFLLFLIHRVIQVGAVSSALLPLNTLRSFHDAASVTLLAS
jgi:hypothetical protein